MTNFREKHIVTETRRKAAELIIIIAILTALAFIVTRCVVPKNETPEIAEPNAPAPPATHREASRRMRVTAYCPCAKCCGQFADGVTASGAKAVGQIVAADTRFFPFGTRMHIPGYGTATVEDRGGAIKGERLDVLFATHQEALEWGVKYLDVSFDAGDVGGGDG